MRVPFVSVYDYENYFLTLNQIKIYIIVVAGREDSTTSQIA